MDTLPRLMPGLPQSIEPLRLAEAQETLAGEIPIAALNRLAACLHSASGTVRFRLSFGTNDLGFVSIRGRYSTSLAMVCQRCLEPMPVTLAKEIRVALVSGREEADMLNGELEPLTLESPRLHLAGFIEDEVMLGLPMAPSHDESQCGMRRCTAGTEPADNPFAVLKDMELGKQ